MEGGAAVGSAATLQVIACARRNRQVDLIDWPSVSRR
jgi:hypothetical protein